MALEVLVLTAARFAGVKPKLERYQARCVVLWTFPGIVCVAPHERVNAGAYGHRAGPALQLRTRPRVGFFERPPSSVASPPRPGRGARVLTREKSPDIPPSRWPPTVGLESDLRDPTLYSTVELEDLQKFS